MNNNAINITISDNDMAAIADAIVVLRTKMPFLISLTAEEKRSLAKMGDKSVAFVNKVLTYGTDNPSLVPGFVDLAALKMDVQLVNQLFSLYAPLSEIVQNMDDTMALAGSEAMSASNSIFKYVGFLNNHGENDAKTVYADLKSRYPGRKAQQAPPTPPATPGS